MAEIFVSYSKQDHAQARLLVAALEAEGYSVWWDAGLLGGEQLRKTIMTELGKARAVIVMWTENSIQSDWAQSEAGRAHADRKLIPLKARGMSYKDIPPPFDNMHTENLDDREKILAAVVAQLSRPEAPASGISRAFARSRLELLSWFGILGTAITLVTNLKGIFTLTDWLNQWLGAWADAVHAFWLRALFFVPEVPVADAVVLTFFAFLTITFSTSLRRGALRRSRWHYLSTYIAVFIVMGITAGGATSVPSFSYYTQWTNKYLLAGPIVAFVNSLTASKSLVSQLSGNLMT